MLVNNIAISYILTSIFIEGQINVNYAFIANSFCITKENSPKISIDTHTPILKVFPGVVYSFANTALKSLTDMPFAFESA